MLHKTKPKGTLKFVKFLKADMLFRNLLRLNLNIPLPLLVCLLICFICTNIVREENHLKSAKP